MEREKAIMRDWSSLPPEVLNLIAKDLLEVPDFVRFRAVCTAWRNSAPVTDLPPQFPWILQTYRDDNDANLRFYSMTFGEFYTIPDPIPMNLWPYEVSEGYLFERVYDLDQNTSSLSLLNPLNNDVIPFLACIGPPRCFRQRYNQIDKYGLCCVLHCRDSEDKLIHCQLGQIQWCELKRDEQYSDYYYFYLNGMLFALHKSTGVTKVTNISTGSLAYVIPPIKDPDIVESSTFLESSGDILRVFTLYDGLGGRLWQVHFLNVTESGTPFWVNIKNIGNRAIFEDADGAFMLEANDLIGIKANCIYSLQPNYRHTQIPFSEVKRFDLQTGVEENLLRRTISNPDVCWFVPNLCHLREQ